MKHFIITALIASTSLLACKSQQPGAMGTDRIEPAKTKNTDYTKNPEQNSTDVVYDIIVSFISKASGIDKEAKARIDQAIVDFNKKNKATVTPEMVRWGREGEIDYNFKFKNLSTTQKKDLATKIKAAIGSSDLVFMAFNKKSVHKR